ncbi:MAG: right-handed parallel beta-helix repeat-containing protein [Methanobacterium sp.]
MILSKYLNNLTFLVFCLTFTLTMCGTVAAAPTNITHDNLSISENQSTYYNSTLKSNNINESAGKTSLPDPQIYKNGTPVARGGHTVGYNFPSIAAAINVAESGDTIMLANGGTFNENDLIIAKNLNFNVFNNGMATINGANNKIFIIDSGVTVTIQNLILENGKTTDGGAIYNKGYLTVKNCTFKDNTATSDGGVIYNTGTYIINNSTFADNTVTGTYGDGGVIYSASGTGTINDCKFTYNTATNDGGTIYIAGGTLNVNGSTFTKNTATIVGGALDNHGYSTEKDCAFTDNTVKSTTGDGGAIGNYGTLTVTISNTFTGNTATYGGAIYSSNNCTINNSSFKNNSAYSSGAIANCGKLNVNGSTFTGNTATIGGGAINNYQGILIATDSNFTGNRVTGTDADGGAIENNQGTSIVTNNTFTRNNAALGGAIFSFSLSNSTINNNTFTNNTATWGGAIGNEQGTLTVTGSTFTGNNATINGGAIENEGTGNLIVKDNKFTNNKSAYGGALFNCFTLTVNGNIFTNNIAIIEGGAIENDDTLTLTASNTFTNNSATVEGGAIENHDNSTITGSTFNNNTATNGGAIRNDGTLTVTGSTFTGNTVKDTNSNNVGGAIENDDTLTVTSSNFMKNIAYYAGAIYNMELCILENSKFTNNSATSGGAIENEGILDVTGSTFTNNTASCGGALFNDNSLIISSSTLSNNTASCGGALFNKNSLNIKYSTLTNNTATTHGGAVYNECSGTSIIQFNRIIGNNNYDIFNNNGSVNANDNWWGTNFKGTNPLAAKRINMGTASYWIVLTITANSKTIPLNGSSTITVNLLHDNNGASVSGVVPYTGLVNYVTSLGTICNSYVSNGIATSTLKAGTISGTTNVSATIDNTTVITEVTI